MKRSNPVKQIRQRGKMTTSVEVQEWAKFAAGQTLRIELPSKKAVVTKILSVKLGDDGYVVEYEVVEYIGDWK